MRYAVLNDGRRVKLETFIAICTEAGGGRLKAFCPSCNVPVVPNLPKKAVGFEATRKEIFSRVSSQRRKPEPGFKHRPHTAGPNCKYYYGNNPDFKGRPTDKDYFAQVRAKNEEVFSDPDIIVATKHVQEYLMQRLTGKPTLSDEDQKKLDNIAAKEFMEMPGLWEHPWLLPFMQVLLVGNYVRSFESGRLHRVAYAKRSKQSFPFTDIDGERRTLIAPYRIVLSHVSADPKAVPIVSMKTREADGRLNEITFHLRKDAAHFMSEQGYNRVARERALVGGRRVRKAPVHPLQIPLYPEDVRATPFVSAKLEPTARKPAPVRHRKTRKVPVHPLQIALI